MYTQAYLAQQFGCAGLIIYSDPADCAPKGEPRYPDGPYLPPGGIQRGSLLRLEGDPLTPGIPSIGKSYHIPKPQCLYMCVEIIIAQLQMVYIDVTTRK